MYLNAAHVSVPDGFMQRAGAGAGLRSRVSGLRSRVCGHVCERHLSALCVCMGGGRGMHRHTHKADTISFFLRA